MPVVADVVLASVTIATRSALPFRIGLTQEAKRGYYCCRQANPEPPERQPPRNGLSHCFGQFIEFVVHNFPFVWLVFAFSLERKTSRNLGFTL